MAEIKDGRRSKFQNWFREQFLKLPDPARLAYLRQYREKLVMKVTAVDDEMAVLDELNHAWKCSLYGWSAAREKRGEGKT